ncbi:hypothetical protein TUM17576_14540 [Enterobacter hormaechei]|nr:hypothetical protein TUM17576_14540 [Enterobacter hormaechei]
MLMTPQLRLFQEGLRISQGAWNLTRALKLEVSFLFNHNPGKR